MNREGQDTLLLFVGVMVLQVGITDLHLRYVKPQMQPLLIASGLVLTVLAVVSIYRATRAPRDTVVTASPTEHVPGGALAVSHGAGPVHAADDDGSRPPRPRNAGAHDDRGLGDRGLGDRGHDDGAHDDGGHEGGGHEGGGHEHAHMPRTAWLLALPLLVLTVITPPSLGAYAAARGSSSIDAPSGAIPPLPAPVDGAVELTLSEFATRAVYAPESLQGSPLRLTGFVLPEESGWSLARIALSCCAADGRPVRVKAVGAAAPAPDSWVVLEGRFDGVDGEGRARVPVLAVDRLQPTEAPVQQYE